MKKFFAILLLAVGFNAIAIAQDTKVDGFANKKIVLEQDVYNLVVNDDVNVIFTDGSGKEILIEGRISEINKIVLAEQNGILEISAPTTFLQKKKAIVYVPARGLRSVTVNGSSMIYSYDKIQNPHLNVFLNGSCQLQIKTFGKIKVINSDEYSFTYQSKNISE
jgi:hypothetical protein